MRRLTTNLGGLGILGLAGCSLEVTGQAGIP